MSQSSSLYRLQQIDSQLDQAHNRLREIEATLNDNTALQHAQMQAQNIEHALQEARKALRRAEDTVQDQHIKIGQTESALYGGKVRNPKELQDLQNEAAALKRYLSVLEDRQLEAMLVVEETEAEHKKSQASLNDVRARAEEQHAGLKGEQSSIEKTVERLVIERHAAISAITPVDLSLYEQLRQNRRGIAVAKVTAKACGACGALLTPVLLQSAAVPSQIVRCSSCGRILYIG
jgi:predicted  nucleic acid-binding Zn-ribbon protein